MRFKADIGLAERGLIGRPSKTINRCAAARATGGGPGDRHPKSAIVHLKNKILPFASSIGRQ
jgi:hypothetical protein